MKKTNIQKMRDGFDWSWFIIFTIFIAVAIAAIYLG